MIGQFLLVGTPANLAGAVPSSSSPSMHQVPTNSSTFFGDREIWVSRSEQWMTLIPTSIASSVELLICDKTLEPGRVLCDPVVYHFRAISTRPCLVMCEIRPGFAPWSTTQVVEFFQSWVSSRSFI